MKSDMLVVNKVELAEHVEVDLEQMRKDTQKIAASCPLFLGLCAKV